MPVSNHDLLKAWQTVLTLSRLQRGANVTILTGSLTHPQTLAAVCADAHATRSTPHLNDA